MKSEIQVFSGISMDDTENREFLYHQGLLLEFAYDSGLCHLFSISKNLTSHNTKQLVFKRVLGLSSNMSFKREHAYNRVALKKKKTTYTGSTVANVSQLELPYDTGECK